MRNYDPLPHHLEERRTPREGVKPLEDWSYGGSYSSPGYYPPPGASAPKREGACEKCGRAAVAFSHDQNPSFLCSEHQVDRFFEVIAAALESAARG